MKKSDNTSPKKTLEAAQKAVMNLDASLEQVKQAARLIRRREGDIIVTGIGKSGFIGQKLTATLTSLGEKAFFLHPTEALHGDFGMLSEGDVLVAFSYSGESKEVVSVARYAKKHFKVLVVAVCRDKRSSLGMLADCCLIADVPEEGSPNGMAPMASTTAMLVLGDMLATALVDRAFKERQFAKFHPGGSLGLSLVHVKDIMHKNGDVPIVKIGDDLNKVLSVMSAKKRKGITGVLDAHQKLVGVITDGDLRRFFKDRFDPTKRVIASDLMTRDPKTISEQATLKEALSLMEEIKVMSLFVLNEKNKVTGFLHMHTIIDGYIV